MNFNGENATQTSFSGGLITADIDMDGNNIDNLATLTMLEMATPVAPTATGSAKYFTDTLGVLNSIDDMGIVRTYETTVSGVQDRIEAPDLSNSVVCANGGLLNFLCSAGIKQADMGQFIDFILATNLRANATDQINIYTI